jgi:hypothetical protein
LAHSSNCLSPLWLGGEAQLRGTHAAATPGRLSSPMPLDQDNSTSVWRVSSTVRICFSFS